VFIIKLKDHVSVSVTFVVASVGYINLLKYRTRFFVRGMVFPLGFGCILGVADLTLPAFVKLPCDGIYFT
jgi:hypothetical protein